jgi:hypothetical protein
MLPALYYLCLKARNLTAYRMPIASSHLMYYRERKSVLIFPQRLIDCESSTHVRRMAAPQHIFRRAVVHTSTYIDQMPVSVISVNDARIHTYSSRLDRITIARFCQFTYTAYTIVRRTESEYLHEIFLNFALDNRYGIYDNSDMKHTIQTAIVAFAIALTTLFTGCTRQYTIIDVKTPQSDGTIAHDYARVDLASGTMCSLHGAFWLNGAFVQSCN